MDVQCLKSYAAWVALLTVTTANIALAGSRNFSTLYTFEVMDPTTLG